MISLNICADTEVVVSGDLDRLDLSGLQKGKDYNVEFSEFFGEMIHTNFATMLKIGIDPLRQNVSLSFNALHRYKVSKFKIGT